MTTLLMIKSHPFTAEHSTSVDVAETFLASYAEVNPTHTIETLDLYSDDIPELDAVTLSAMNALAQGQEFTSLTTEQQSKMLRLSEITDQFLSADKIVIANALWNLGIPTKLKAWFDAISVPGKTFAYTEKGPVGLVENKKVLHIQSSGGTYDGSDMSSQYVKYIMSFLGVKDHTGLFIEAIDHHPEMREEILSDVKTKAVTLAKTF